MKHGTLLIREYTVFFSHLSIGKTVNTKNASSTWREWEPMRLSATIVIKEKG